MESKGVLKLNKKEFIEYFLDNFPEYRSIYIKHIEEYEELLLHVFFGDTLNKKILKLLSDDKNNKNQLYKVFNFLEQMALDKNIEIKEVLTVTILERLGDNKNLLKKAYTFMGEYTKKLSLEIEQFWGRA
ncbi:MAG: hypothetical protein K0S61_4525 [Anaerocolumna sp.]|jgi:hypothetical protein|nr:hypothetical protein [Anaerocolumna sp.]